MNQNNHERFMRVAIEEALKGKGKTDPNPIVGAVIVEDNEIVAKGFHERAGQAHAEVSAISNLGRTPKLKAILYVTLEPCSTFGRTPPCTQAIIDAGFRHVVFGVIDDNPKHGGSAIKILQTAGIQVEYGILVNECRALNLKD